MSDSTRMNIRLWISAKSLKASETNNNYCLSRWLLIVCTVWYFWIMSLLLLAFSFAFANAFLCFFWIFSSVKANHFFDFTEMARARRFSGEGSAETQRRLAIESASLRATSWIKGALQQIPLCVADNSLKQCSKSNGLKMALFLFMKEGRFGELGLRNVRGLPMRHSWYVHDNYRWC